MNRISHRFGTILMFLNVTESLNYDGFVVISLASVDRCSSVVTIAMLLILADILLVHPF